ncbi:serine hydrolase [Spirulina subsalsa FACHB-351]|uniref:Serine hydrolase n=1 Tax=Spirulina subsalsa FACHB-351 TaxID=234711 RepID=A0ABT3L3V0_9CYAN|nr:serine hydrolase [Spirulina subsalsa]MCW6036184.1 serine hydrolase [Spirulina subsalsa FACHB-351]
MDRQYQSQGHDPHRRIAQLEYQLNRADQTIRRLKRENEELRQQISRASPGFVRDSVGNLSHIGSQKYQDRPDQSQYSVPNRNQIYSDSHYGKMLKSKLQFIGIVSLIVAICSIIGFYLTRPDSSTPPPESESGISSDSLGNDLTSPSDNRSNSAIPTLPYNPLNRQNRPWVYNVRRPPQLTSNNQLTAIVRDIQTLVDQKGLPTQDLSITLIDVEKSAVAGYNPNQLRYPASIVKLFWLTAFYSQVANGQIPDAGQYVPDLEKMIRQSDNEAASRIVDLITGTQSGVELIGENYKKWEDKRFSLNQFFQSAGYQGINISQKTFPLPYLQYSEPQGRDLQIRGPSPERPIRNSISTEQAARLMYEIVTEQAISREYSRDMKGWLEQDLDPRKWQSIDPHQGHFNPIRAFFGEGLYTGNNIIFLSKAGWTSGTRKEVAYVSNGRTSYILAVFGENSAYSQDEKIFPEISRLVFQRMNQLN